jgi:Domain of unknown function (DUF932)
MTLTVHAGGKCATRDELSLVPLPEATESYTPVPHNHLAETLMTIGRDILQGYALESEQYALAREGNQMFGVVTFRGEHPEMGLSIGFRNSYDKSMAIGIAIGAKVFVCDNLALAGDVTVLRKHTGNVWASLEDVAISTLYRSQKNFQKVVEDAEILKNKSISDTGAFQYMGLLYGKGVLTPRQLPVVKREWLKPSHEDFQPRTMWSFYNACTEAMKSAPPVLIMEKHIMLHEVMIGGIS